MPFFRNRLRLGPQRFLGGLPAAPTLRSLALVAGLLGGALAVWGALPDRARLAVSGDLLERIFFREIQTPDGLVDARRPPLETRAALGQQLAATPDAFQLYALRALEAERALDFTAAERDWQAHAERAADPSEAQLALADFYGRRNRAAEETAALLGVGRAPSPASERFTPASEQRSWKAFERALGRIDVHLLGDDLRADVYRAWLGRYPDQKPAYEGYLSFLLGVPRLPAAEDLLADFTAQFPDDPGFALAGRARIAVARDGDAAGLMVYEDGFEPLWPEALLSEYFGLLGRAERLRTRLDESGAALSADPADLNAAAWIFHYRRRSGDSAAALQALNDYAAARQSWDAADLETLADLYRLAEAHTEAARCYYALYSLPGAPAPSRQAGLEGLIDVLLTAADQPLAFGTRNLSIYEDIARADTGPGALNGVLSLLLNTQGINWRFDSLDQLSRPYFRRAAAVELLARLDAESPGSGRRAALRAKAVGALALYGDDEAILSEGRRFLEQFPGAAERMDVSLRMAEAYARQERVDDELAVYDRLLTELAEASDGVPLGPGAVQPLVFRPSTSRQGPRSPAYARALDLAVSRLTGLGRLPAALELFAREIRRNPDDPGLYERFAGFLSANGLGERVEAVYRQAMGQFEDRSWEHRLGRLYLRSQKRAELEALTRQSVDAFSGLEVEQYFQTVNPGALDAQLYLQLNLYAHQRFPHNLTFVRNLINAYRNPATNNATAAAELLRRHWFHADDLRAQYFGLLTRTGRLEQTLAAIESGSDAARQQRWAALTRENPAAALLLAEGRAWRCRYEEAGPVFLAVATETPVDEPVISRAIDLSRSLASGSPILTDVAVALSESLSNSRPASRDQLAFTGDILADRKLYQRADPFWRRMADAEPGRPESWLEAATVFWDYYLFEDALELLEQGRERIGRRTLFSYEAGAIAEGRRDPDGAIREYLQGALSGGYASAGRLATLSGRDGYREPIEQATSGLTASANPSEEAIRLRLSVLDAQQRRDDAAALLLRLAGDAGAYALLDIVEREATNRNLGVVRAAGLERRIELTRDPVDKLRRRLELARLLEAQGETAAAERASAAVYGESPRVLGVVRARVDFLWRSGRKPQAVETLAEAAAASYPDLAKKFRLEAAQKAINAELYDRSRELLAALLAEEPFQSQFLAAMADSFARQGRDADLRSFYEGKLEAVEASELDLAAKRNTVALLRRGLIPALERLEDHAGAIDQYIELVNRFPEDEPLVEQAGLYALRHGLAARLEAAYVRTTEASPRDVRYHRVLARLRLLFEDLPGALAAYDNALALRPDSVELHQARAGLLERQLLFEPARQAFERLYELSYEEPRWMEKIGELHVRLGDAAAAEAAVRKARIDGRPARPDNFFDAARTLAGWGLDEPGLRLAEEGVTLAGGRLLPEHNAGAALYARLATRLRRHDVAWVRLRAAAGGDEGLSWALQQPAEAILQTADELFTPEEKTSLEAVLDRWRNQASPEEMEQALLPALAASQFASVEARWRRERLLAQPAGPFAANDRRRLTEIEQARMRHDDLGRALELHWQAHPARNQERQILDEAAAAFRAAGDFDAELRILELQQGQGRWGERYLELLLQRDPERLIALAAAPDQGLAHNAANFAVLYGTAEQTRRAVETVGRGRPPVWTPAYTGLAGLFHQAADEVFGQAFLTALGEGTIGERVGRPVDRTRQLAGDRWFEYGVRYGEYLSVTGGSGAEDYLYAQVEANPGRAAAYAAVAELHRAAGDSTAAEREYLHALELAPRDPTTHLRLAEIAWEANRRDEALGFWRTALVRYAEQIEEFRLGPSFWDEVPPLLGTVARGRLTGELRAELDKVLGTYVRKSGAYRIGEFVEPFLLASADQSGEWAKIVALAPSSDNPVQLLTALATLDWVLPELRSLAAEAALTQAEAALAQSGPNERWYLLEAVFEARLTLAKLDLAAGRNVAAWNRLRPADEELAARLLHQEAALVFTAGALSGRTAEALELVYPEEYSGSYYGPYYGSDPLAEADQRLRAAGAAAEADGLLEARYQQQIDRRELGPAPLLGLAELRLRQGRTAEAAALIDRLLRVSDEPFAQHLPAAELLLEHEAFADAVRLLDARVRAAPWDNRARLRLAQAQRDAGAEGLLALARSPAVEYSIRAEAAATLQGRSAGGSLGSAELDWLATRAGSPDQPHFFAARLAAAEQVAGAEKARLLGAALAERPQPAPLDLRRSLFKAEIAADRPIRALSALQPLLAPYGLGYLIEQLDPAFGEDAHARRADAYMAMQFLRDQGLSAAERAEIAARAAGLLRALGQLGSAETLFDLARMIEPTAPVAEELAAVREQRRLGAANASRRPVIQEGLEQPHAVRPRHVRQRQGGSR